jgi:hypothetical protein
MHQAWWWLVRAVVYYALFEALTPFAIMFGAGWPRISEGAVFAVVMATLHPHIRRASTSAAHGPDVASECLCERWRRSSAARLAG